MSNLLEINNLWGGYKEGVNILCGISLEIQRGEALGIIGLNGSGKSTFGKAIMNMIPFRKGNIFFEGEDVTSLTTSMLSNLGISLMQQGGKVFPCLSVWENMQMASKGDISQIIDIIPLLQRTKKELHNMMADKLSGGQKHQLSLAMTLATNPRLIILDEPSAGLAPIAVEKMYELLHAVRDNFSISIVLIEQNIAKAVNFCERSLLLKQGKMVFETKGNVVELENLMFNK